MRLGTLYWLKFVFQGNKYTMIRFHFIANTSFNIHTVYIPKSKYNYWTICKFPSIINSCRPPWHSWRSLCTNNCIRQYPACGFNNIIYILYNQLSINTSNMSCIHHLWEYFSIKFVHISWCTSDRQYTSWPIIAFTNVDFKPLARFSRNLAWMLCHLSPSQCHNFEFSKISNINTMGGRTREVGVNCSNGSNQPRAAHYCASTCAIRPLLGQY
jgi:hypothetical protein